MKYMRHIKQVLASIILCCCCSHIEAQTVKEICVSQDNSYTDHLSLKDDVKDMDLMVKFIFDEATNTLNVSLISYRNLFVFQTDTQCRQAIRHRKIKPEKLPFVVNAEPDVKYQLNKKYWKSIPKRRSKHVFRKWADYSGLMPIPAEYKMVNDYIAQDYSILNKADAVSISLHDVMMVEEKPAKKAGSRKYEIVWGKDLDITYRIRIERNPCFGNDEELAASVKLLESIQGAYGSFAGRYGSGIVRSQESLDNFTELQQMLIEQFPRKQEKNACPDIQYNWDTYNQYVDSIGNMRVEIEEVIDDLASLGLNADYILTQARRIDTAVSIWVSSKDNIERADMIKQCNDIISLVDTTVSQSRVCTSEQQNAINIFNQAVRYFRHTCNQ